MALIEDEQTAERRRRRRGGGGAIQTTPTGPGPGSSGGSGGGGSSSDSKASSDKGGSKGAAQSSGKGEGKDDGSGDAEKYRRKAGRRYLDQAKNLEAQAAALRYALRNSYKGALQVKLQNVNEILKQQDRSLMQGYRDRVGALKGSLEDNEKAASTQTLANEQNRVRERNDALSEIAAQGAGESDAMAAQLMSLRNWQATQSEVERNKFDTLRSINSSLTDLNVDTKTGRINLQSQALADKEQLWTNYYNQRSESLTQLGNTLGQMADYKEMAQEYGVGKGGDIGDARKAFMQAAKTAGKAWESPGISKKLRRWDGRNEFEVETSKGPLRREAPSVDLGKAPEGATLRKW